MHTGQATASICMYLSSCLFVCLFVSLLMFTDCIPGMYPLQIVDGVLTQDSDAFLYGATVVYKDFTITVCTCIYCSTAQFMNWGIWILVHTCHCISCLTVTSVELPQTAKIAIWYCNTKNTRSVCLRLGGRSKLACFHTLVEQRCSVEQQG